MFGRIAKTQHQMSFNDRCVYGNRLCECMCASIVLAFHSELWHFVGARLLLCAFEHDQNVVKTHLKKKRQGNRNVLHNIMLGRRRNCVCAFIGKQFVACVCARSNIGYNVLCIALRSHRNISTTN